MSIHSRAQALQDLHESPTILRVVNVWDAITAKVVADLPQTTAIATAGHAIAASHGYEDGTIPLTLTLPVLESIVQATELPVTADLDDGYDDPADTVRKVIDVGVVGANVEDRLRPIDEATARVAAITAAAAAAGIPFQLNARTDAFVLGGDRDIDTIVSDAISRGRAYLDAGASLIFVPGKLDAEITRRLADGIGRGRLSVIGVPGALTASEYEELGVARISYGPWVQRYALTALKGLATSLYGSGDIPASTEVLN